MLFTLLITAFFVGIIILGYTISVHDRYGRSDSDTIEEPRDETKQSTKE